jgi:hypothetical protein
MINILSDDSKSSDNSFVYLAGSNTYTTIKSSG